MPRKPKRSFVLVDGGTGAYYGRPGYTRTIFTDILNARRFETRELAVAFMTGDRAFAQRCEVEEVVE